MYMYIYVMFCQFVFHSTKVLLNVFSMRMTFLQHCAKYVSSFA